MYLKKECVFYFRTTTDPTALQNEAEVLSGEALPAL